MKNLIILFVFVLSIANAGSLYKTVEDSTSSGVTEGSLIPDEKRPAGFIIKHVRDEPKAEVVFNDAGKVLDEDGNIKLIRLNVKFDFDKSNIKEEYKEEIQEAFEFLMKHKSLTTTVEGHTDSTGAFDYNQKLSVRRASSVSQALIEEGISKELIEVKGFGETIPVASNNTKDGRAQNRRVDISFNK